MAPMAAGPRVRRIGEYATRYACLFFAALDTALGNDYGLSGFHGVDRAGRYRVYSIGPANKIFSFGDGPDDPGLAPEMFWMAKRFNNPVYAWSEQKQLERSTHPDAYDLAWFVRDARPPQAAGVAARCGVPRRRRGHVPFFVGRSERAVPGREGGDNKVPHAHLDLGSFMIDAGGVRWASDYDEGRYQRAGSAAAPVLFDPHRIA
jgi:hypothetical protein